MGCGVSSVIALKAENPPTKVKNETHQHPKPVIPLGNSNIRALRRLSNELKDVFEQHPEFVVTPLNLNETYFEWVAVLPGPSESPYAGGSFIIDINIPENYPMDPPKLKFRTPIYHPNISGTGKVCLNILKPGEWSPILSLSAVLISVQALLSDPNPEDPLNVKAAEVMLKSRAVFAAQARSFTARYAHTEVQRTEEDEQEFEHLQRDGNGQLVDEDRLVRILTSGKKF